MQRARPFVFSTAAPPAMAWALGASLDVVRDEPDRRARLRSLAAHLRGRLREAGLDDKNSIRIGVDQVDAVLAAAARHGFCLEWVGGPDDELSPFVPRPPQVPA